MKRLFRYVSQVPKVQRLTNLNPEIIRGLQNTSKTDAVYPELTIHRAQLYQKPRGYTEPTDSNPR